MTLAANSAPIAVSSFEVQSTQQTAYFDNIEFIGGPITPPTGGLVGRWKLDESSGVVASDTSGNGNNGTLSNGPVWTIGHVDNGLKFDGANDYVNLGDPAELEGMSALTVSAWVNLDDLASDAFIIGDSGTDDSLGRYRLWFDDIGFKSGRTDIWSFAVHNGTSWYTLEGALPATTGWVHVTGVFDGSDSNTPLTLYVNGTQDTLATNAGLSAAPTVVRDTAANHLIGMRRDNNSPMDGTLDEVRIYDKALSQAEIADLFDSSVGQSTTYYVDDNDPNTVGNGAGTSSNPFKTIQSAVDIVRAGDTVLIKAGTYPSIVFQGVHGTSTAPITFKPDSPADQVVLDRNLAGGAGNGFRVVEFEGGNSYVVLDGLEITDTNDLNAQYKDPQHPNYTECDLVNDIEGCATFYKANFEGKNGIKINARVRLKDAQGNPLEPNNDTEEAVADPSESHHLTFKNLTIHGVADQAILGQASFSTIIDNHMYNNGVIGEGYGMYVHGTGLTVQGNDSHDANGHGIRLGNTKHPLFNSVIEGNETYNNKNLILHFQNFTTPAISQSTGITLWHGSGNLFKNNISYGNGAFGLRINADNNEVYNNTIYDNGKVPFSSLPATGIYSLQKNNILFNNIVYNNQQGNISVGTGTTMGNNLTSNPSFADAPNGDFHLTSASTNAIDQGVDPGNDPLDVPLVPTDFDGNLRPLDGDGVGGAQYDIGAFEFVPPASLVALVGETTGSTSSSYEASASTSLLMAAEESGEASQSTRGELYDVALAELIGSNRGDISTQLRYSPPRQAPSLDIEPSVELAQRFAINHRTDPAAPALRLSGDHDLDLEPTSQDREEIFDNLFTEFDEVLTPQLRDWPTDK